VLIFDAGEFQSELWLYAGDEENAEDGGQAARQPGTGRPPSPVTISRKSRPLALHIGQRPSRQKRLIET
jgi:hypothetical protein